MDYPIINFDPVLLDLGFFQIRWYALAYIFGMLGGTYWMTVLAARPPILITADELWDCFTWLVFGIIIGGRLGWAIFYDYRYLLEDPVQILRIWEGGMAFHGGLLGIIAAIFLFAHRRRLNPLNLADLIACATPLGLFLGRIANFINGELWGRPSTVPWAVIFPRAIPPVPRHPSQIYEALLEGLLIFIVLGIVAWRTQALSRPGLCTGLFLLLYGLCRSSVEFFRARGNHSDIFMPDWLSMGQFLSLPMILAGLLFIGFAVHRPTVTIVQR